MSVFKLTYKPYGSHAILIEWPSEIDKDILSDVISFKDQILQNNSKVIIDVINTYNSLTIIYDLTISNIYNEILALKTTYITIKTQEKTKKYRWKIPVCYDLNFGIDLQEISQKTKLDIETIINLHSATIYTIFFIGFLPGFLYLGGLDKRLFLDRKSTPRLTVKEGAVAFAGMQTGVYPSESAGGWNIIGNTPISFFEPQSKQPCFAASGDEIQFFSISIEAYKQLKIQIAKQSYKPEKIQLYD